MIPPSALTSVFNSPPVQLQRTLSVIEQGISEGLHTGAQIYVSQNGQPITDSAVGQNSPDVRMTTDTILPWLSAGKPLAVAALALLWQRNQLDIDDAVSEHIPEFAAHNKGSITIRHLLTHTGGFRWAEFSPTSTWDQIIHCICDARIEPRWQPGHKAGYHAFTSWYILAEIVQRHYGKSFETAVRDEILLPLGMTDVRFTISRRDQELLGSRLASLHGRLDSRPKKFSFDSADGGYACVPAAGARGPASQLGAFYEMLLRRGTTPAGDVLLLPQTVEAITARHRAGMLDHTFKQVVDWGLGFIINSAIYGSEMVPYGYGPHASARTFGHGGSQSSAAFADPEFGLAVAVIFNGMPGEIAHTRRIHATLGALYEDLGLSRAAADAPPSSASTARIG